MTTFKADNVTTIGTYAFSDTTKLTKVNFPNVTTLTNNVFRNATGLTEASFSNLLEQEVVHS